MQWQVKTVLNAIQPFAGFVYRDIRLPCHRDGQPRCLAITVRAQQGRAARCSRCRKPAPGYDQLAQRWWLFVPLWGIVTWFLYAARRVHCPEHGVVVEHVPWSDGKRPVTIAMMCFLSRWARRLSWRETARAFGTSWECVYRSVQWFVEWGLAHRILEGIRAIGVDEIHWGKSQRADNFLTVIYQIDGHGRRLFRFHITSHLNQAVDEVRRAESGRRRGRPVAEKLKKMRWKLLRKGSRVRGRAKRRLCGLLHSKLATGRAWMLKETFHDFWRYRSLTWASAFLEVWRTRALRSRLEPMKEVARMRRGLGAGQESNHK
jgi:transposase